MGYFTFKNVLGQVKISVIRVKNIRVRNGFGGVPKRLNGTVLKTVVAQATVSSNLTPSAKKTAKEGSLAEPRQIGRPGCLKSYLGFLFVVK